MFQDRFGQRPATRFDSAGNRLPGMIINVWNLRFMQSELGDPADQPVMVSSALQVVKVGSESRIRGTISNRAPQRLQNISIATRAGVARVFTAIESGATLPIDVAIEASTVKAVDISQYQPYNYYGQNQQNPHASFARSWALSSPPPTWPATRSRTRSRWHSR
jgi:hypothetical protein